MPNYYKVYHSIDRLNQGLGRVPATYLFYRRSYFHSIAAFLLLVICSFSSSEAAEVSNLTAFFRSGQVFLTWNNISDTTTYYKVYRSLSPIVSGSQLASCEYLGWTYQQSSKDNDLSRHDKAANYFRLDSAGTPLTSLQGLFVATTLLNGSYYYAVTTFINQIEDTLIIAGQNSLVQPMQETVMKPSPVFQEFREEEDGESENTIEVYTYFTSFKIDPQQPPINKAGFFAGDFLLFRNNDTLNQPLCIQFHGGGADLFWNITADNDNAVNLNVEEYSPAGEGLEYWGANSGYNIYSSHDTTATCGTNYNFMQWRYGEIIDWAIHHLTIDSNRIYMIGTSAGACGAFIYSITYPDRIAATKLSVPAFDFSYLNDWQTNCSLNQGKKTRVDIDCLFGTVTSNLPCSLGKNTFNAVNGAEIISENRERNYPLIYSINGKNDVMVGWSEKTIYYDSVNMSHVGGYYFWDSRTHSGTGATWGENFDLFRYRRDRSYPAFANCNLNEDFGNGNGNSGAAFGSLNGMLDWSNDPTEDSLQWSSKIFIRSLSKWNNQQVTYADSATTDVTPRRLQHFKVPPRSNINWKVIHHGQTVQSGTQSYDGGLIVITAVKIFKDTSTLQITYSPRDTFYADADSDGYGNSHNYTTAYQAPRGFTTDKSDCNDASSSIHPYAAETCNGVDDNCNGQIDEGIGMGSTYYADADGDGYGNPSVTITSCSPPSGFVADNTDCNDAAAAIHPNANEICNSIDDNCNGQIDEGGLTNYYADSDGDGYGNASVFIQSCSAVNGYVTNSTDCNDAVASIHPNANEICNSIDDNCDGQIDEGISVLYYLDADGDGYGDVTHSISGCSIPPGYVTNHTDCNDSNSSIHPSESETCNGLDDNCDGQIDEGVSTLYYADNDLDGYGNLLSVISACSAPAGYVNNSSDCNDNAQAIHPGAIEICNSVDDNCNGQIDDGIVTATITALGVTTFCSGSSVTFQANSGSGLTYQWKLNGTNISGATKIKYTAKSGGAYTVEVKSGSCSSVSSVITVTVNPLPTAKITSKGDLNICSTGSVLLKASAFTGNSYQWLMNSLPISGATEANYTATAAGSYTVKITSSFGCTKTSPAVVVTKPCRNSDEADATINSCTIYPNPSNGLFNIEATGFNGQCNIEVFDAIGKRIYEGLLTPEDDKLTAEIRLPENLTSGIYFVRLFDGQTESVQQLVIDK